MTLLFLSLLPSSVYAQEGGTVISTFEESEFQFRLGLKAYEEFNYDEALGHMLLSNRLSPDETVIYNIAAIYEVTNRHAEAYNAYATYSALPGITDERARVARQALNRLASKVALIEVASKPTGAQVFVDKVENGVRGTTPLTLAVTPGEHRVLLGLSGHRDNEMDVVVKRGKSEAVELELEPILVDVVISGEPSNATIRNLDLPDAPQQTVGSTFQLPAGRYTLEVGAEGHVSQQVPIDLADGRVGRYQVTLEQRLDEAQIRRLFANETKGSNQTRIYGYIDSYWEQVAKTPVAVVVDGNGNETVEREDNPYEFDVLNLHFMVQGTIAGKFRYFLNLAGPGSGGVDDEGFGIRNAWVEAPLFRDYLRVRAGKMYRRFGLYNEILDATPTFIGIEPPELFDKDHLLLTRTTNLMLFGQIDAGLNTIQYSVSTGNDERSGFSVPVGADLRLNNAGTVTVGTSAYWSGTASPTRDVGEGAPAGGVINWMAEDRYAVIGAYFEYTGGAILQTEYWRASHNGKRDVDRLAALDEASPFITEAQRSRYFDANDEPIEDVQYTVQTAYVRGGVPVALGERGAEITPYAQFDWYSNPETLAPKSVGGDNEAGFSDDGQFFKVTAGTVIRPVRPVALKIDGSAHIQQLAKETEFYPEVRVSLSYLWELNLK